MRILCNIAMCSRIVAIGISALIAAFTNATAVGQESLWQSLYDAGLAASQRGDLAGAEKQLKAALVDAERLEKPEQNVLLTLRALAKVFLAQGKIGTAENIVRKILSIEGDHGDKLSMFQDMRLLEQLLIKENNSGAAAAIAKQAIELARDSKECGAMLPDLLVDRAMIDQLRGDFSDVESLLVDAMRLNELSYGAQSPSTISCGERLADFYAAQSRCAEAEPLYNRAISLRRKKAAGNASPEFSSFNTRSMLKDMNALAHVYVEQGRTRSAKDLLEEALVLTEKQFGSNDLEVSNQLILSARTVTEEEPVIAERLLHRALAIRSDQLDASDPRIADVDNELGRVHMEQCAYDLAESEFQQALAIDQNSKDGRLLRVAKDLSSLGKLNLDQGKYSVAQKYYEQALDMTKEASGDKSADAATAMNNLALLYRNQGQYGAARQLIRQALAIRENVLGKSHPVVAQNLVNLADVLSAAGEASEAEPLLRRALAINEASLGSDHRYVALVLHDLIDVSLAQATKCPQAEIYARKLLAVDERTMNSGSPIVIRDLHLLAAILIEQGKISEAKSIKQKLTKLEAEQTAPDNQSFVAQAPGPFPNIYHAPVEDKWAVVVGISNFQDPHLNLKFAAKDATDFRDFLVKDANFRADHVKLLTDKDATRANIVGLLGEKWLKRVVQPGDLAVIYISSHGTQAARQVGGANFIVPYEADKDNIVLSGIPMQWLLAGVNDLVHCQRVCLFLDVCHSGAAVAAATNRKVDAKGDCDLGTTGNSGMNKDGSINSKNSSNATESGAKGLHASPLPSMAADATAPAFGQVVVAASQSDQVSWDSKRYANGVFTHRLIEGLKLRGEHTTVTDAFAYLKDKVEDEVLRDRAQLQSPIMVPRHFDGCEPELSCHSAKPRPVELEMEFKSIGTREKQMASPAVSGDTSKKLPRH